jgi:serine protease Do
VASDSLRRARVPLSRASLVVGLLLACGIHAAALASDARNTIAKVKRSVVAVGTYEATRTPAFQFRGTGFAVGDGSLIATNAHVLPSVMDVAGRERLAILVPGQGSEHAQVRDVTRVSVDDDSDLALLKLSGAVLPPLELRDSDSVREGEEILMTGFPIGNVLGPYPATHRGMVAAITPIAIPQQRAADLGGAVLRRLSSGSFMVFQLDATAYPGNSGSPIYDPLTGEVLGVVNMVLVKRTKEDALTHPSGITYALPARHLSALINAMR